MQGGVSAGGCECTGVTRQPAPINYFKGIRWVRFRVKFRVRVTVRVRAKVLDM